ncbi:PREDICTED: cell growth-regulating nucleolar protein [Habropoda laboriosa]|uniref:cell growth-regulating nucleolar protein n=1 Tax=Habropoda laboriosa TaxID=597456 RepID=UPI00083CAA30|nr:PREDICTED: cell growth-regulating nucleolar protein [Habropoda laboriosa]XP_017792333.1 PREDICTED: cell growth-regulating nucleolar protein [Habropoda laboriosa]
MVVFTCNNCGDTIQKPKVAKHYEFHCRTAQFLTCVDCFKDFRGEEYIAHTKCVTEAERYGGKDYVPKANINKGEKKQQEWLNIVNNVLNSQTNLSKSERTFLNALSRHENIPRKRTKFLNFVQSALGPRVNQAVVECVWNKMEAAYKNTQNTNTKQEQQNGKINKEINDKEDISTHHESNVIENQNNENICRENKNESHENKCNELNGTCNIADNGNINKVKKKKSTKRSVSETVQEQSEEPVEKKRNLVPAVTDEPVTKKKNKKGAATEEPVPTVKSEDPILSESLVGQSDSTIDKSNFNWGDTILDIVKSKGEISLKKLQKKVISQYMNFSSNAVTHEKASSKFNKKLKKVSGIIVSDEKVKLA